MLGAADSDRGARRSRAHLALHIAPRGAGLGGTTSTTHRVTARAIAGTPQQKPVSEPSAYVHLDLNGVTRRVGRLWASSRWHETATFEYDADWLADPRHRALEPALPSRHRALSHCARAAAAHFDLRPNEARSIAGETARAVRRWRATAAKHSIASPEIERMASAFEHADATAARRWSGSSPN
jgi:hypothetical protein